MKLAWIPLLALAACAEPQPVIPEERFVSALVALRRAAQQLPPGADFTERRAEVLREVGVTEDELRAFVREGARYPRRLADAWDSAAARLAAPPPAEPRDSAPRVPGRQPRDRAPRAPGQEEVE